MARVAPTSRRGHKIASLTMNVSYQTNASTCQDILIADKAARRQEILEAARQSADKWASSSIALSIVCLILDVLILLAIFHLRRHRSIQHSGVGYLMCVVMACIFGHLSSLMDGLPVGPYTCRGKLAIIYLFIYGLLAPLVAKLVSLLRASKNVLLSGTSAGWGMDAVKITVSIIGLQLVLVIFYLGLTAGKEYREDRLQTVCSDAVSEHFFHAMEGLLTAGLLLVAFGILIWLRCSTSTRDVKDLLLTTITITGGAVGLLQLLLTSSNDLAWASAVVPVRLMIIMLVAWFNVGFQVSSSRKHTHPAAAESIHIQQQHPISLFHSLPVSPVCMRLSGRPRSFHRC